MPRPKRPPLSKRQQQRHIVVTSIPRKELDPARLAKIFLIQAQRMAEREARSRESSHPQSAVKNGRQHES